MDDRWETEVIEYGAINITGFRIVDTSRRYVKEFLDGWKRLDPTTSLGAGKESISVRILKHLFHLGRSHERNWICCLIFSADNEKKMIFFKRKMNKNQCADIGSKKRK